ncbi:MAG: hypothetical protein WD696_00860 [Bryobacteraceae bacterium]
MWLKPELVAYVEFTDWTKVGQGLALRRPPRPPGRSTLMGRAPSPLLKQEEAGIENTALIL